MRLSRTTRRVLLACVVSNAGFAAIGVGLVTQQPTVPVASGDVRQQLPTGGANTTETSTPLTSAPLPADTSSAQSTPSVQRSPSTRASSSTRTASTSTAAAANDVTGIASSAAPPTPPRVAPDAGSYPATFTGSASVNGRGQSFPASGAVVFTPAGADLRQSAPNTPGDVELTQRFSSAKSSLVRFQMKAGDETKVFSPASPVTYLVYDAAPGTAWSWEASSSDGATHLDARAQVVGQQTMQLDGQAVPVLQITTSITIAGDITGTAELTVWVAPELRLPLMQRQVINAKAKSGYGLTTRLVSDVTQTLTTLRPA